MVASKSFTIIWDGDALDHLKEILTYLSKQSNIAPKIVKDAVLSKLETIKTNAFICETDKLKDVSNTNFRAFIVYSYIE